MSKYINLNGNTWDGNSISSKIRHDDKYGAFITLGWLSDAPSIDLAEHDKQIRADAIDETLRILNGIDCGIRCAMCTNANKSDRGCDGGCKVDNAMLKKVMDVVENFTKSIEQLKENNQ